ncbi:AI-2E family transporter [Anaerovorax odorimutans]|uniref:AI-2E family transporter n=1 Tax=Anaerovorax odorimutans TaxID=109327 RepID=UPI0004144E7C|nr:AI-2E family transporter [Anaerovorax odorimutans]
MDEKDILKIYRKIKEGTIAIAALVLMIITISYMLDIVLLTFIITFLFYNLLKIIKKQIRRFIEISIADGIILSILYIVFISILIISIIEIYPKLTQQIIAIADLFKGFDIKDVREVIDPRLAEFIPNLDVNKYVEKVGSMLATGATTIGGFGINIFLSMILSYFLLLEKGKIRRFGEKLERSKISFLYRYLIKFGGNFVKTFSKVMKVQVTIAIINSVISMIILTILGFPQIAGLGIMIFILGLIPVAGVIISLVPLSIIAFNIGGINKVIAVVIMIVIIHSIEAYILNPKLMSNKTELPVCFVFIILLVGEHYLGVWGLLIGVPIFIFLMNVLEVDYEGTKEHKKKRREIKERIR